MPTLNGKDSAVFVAVIEEVFPKDISDYESRWQKIYRQKLSEKRPPSVERMREFVLRLWPTLFSARERERMASSKTLDDLESAVVPFWLFPRRVRVKVKELFAGSQESVLVLYTGLSGGDCGVDFKVGEHWLIDAGIDAAGRLIGHQCSVTIPVDKADAVLAKLRSERR